MHAPQEVQMTKAVSAPDRLTPPEDLSGTARAILRTRMAFHARDMGALMSAVMLLKYELIHERATGIANDASLARPLTGDATELNSALPEKFFAFQDELRAAATALAAAAAEQDPQQTADTYGQLSKTCVKCHATYRKGQSHRSSAP
jgi:cytochrome c556